MGIISLQRTNCNRLFQGINTKKFHKIKQLGIGVYNFYKFQLLCGNDKKQQYLSRCSTCMLLKAQLRFEFNYIFFLQSYYITQATIVNRPNHEVESLFFFGCSYHILGCLQSVKNCRILQKTCGSSTNIKNSTLSLNVKFHCHQNSTIQLECPGGLLHGRPHTIW